MKQALNVIILNLQDNTCGQYLKRFDDKEARDECFNDWVRIAKNLCSVGLKEDGRIIGDAEHEDEYTEVRKYISNANLRFIIMSYPS